jgi:hypothetical protein
MWKFFCNDQGKNNKKRLENGTKSHLSPQKNKGTRSERELLDKRISPPSSSAWVLKKLPREKREKFRMKVHRCIPLDAAGGHLIPFLFSTYIIVWLWSCCVVK